MAVDLQTIHKGRENAYEFSWMGKQIVLLPSAADIKNKQQTSTNNKQDKSTSSSHLFSLINGKQFLQKYDSLLLALIVK